MTFLDAATELISEIVLVTARVGDVCTIVRAQQGTTAKTWNAADIASQLVTAGDSENFIQGSGLQSGLYNYTPGIGTNSITATLQSALVALAKSLGANLEIQIGELPWALAEAEARRAAARQARPKEFGGRAGPDPIRYGDWEVKGLASDF